MLLYQREGFGGQAMREDMSAGSMFIPFFLLLQEGRKCNKQQEEGINSHCNIYLNEFFVEYAHTTFRSLIV